MTEQRHTFELNIPRDAITGTRDEGTVFVIIAANTESSGAELSIRKDGLTMEDMAKLEELLLGATIELTYIVK